MLFSACHVQAQFLNRRGLGIELAHDLTLVHNKDAVGQVHDLVQLQADEENSLAFIALGHDLLVDILDRADVQAAGGLDSYQQVGVFIDLAGDNGFLLVAAGHATGDRDGTLAAAHVVLFDEALGIVHDSTFLMKPWFWNSGCQ